MAVYKTFLESASGVKIEVEDGAATTPNPNSGDLFKAIAAITKAFVKQISNMPKEQRPAEVELTYALKALGAGGFAISLAQDSANFKVRMSWSGSPAGGLLDLPQPGKPGVA